MCQKLHLNITFIKVIEKRQDYNYCTFTHLCYDLNLLTGNIKEFERLENLKILENALKI